MPRSISLSADDKPKDKKKDAPKPEDENLTPEQLIAKKLAELQQKLEGK